MPPEPPEIVEDARGLLCPIPVIRLAARIRTLAPGESVTLLADDPAAEEDVRLWCRGHRQEFLGATPVPEGFIRIRVKRSR